MQLLNVIAARSTWIFDVNDLNPRGKSVMDELIEWLKDAYNFEQAPKSATDIDAESKGLIFKRGNFQVKEESFVNVEATLFSDGIVANSWSSTKDTDAFIEDALTSIVKEFGLTFDPKMVRLKGHISELTVRLDQQLTDLSSSLNDFASKVTEKCDRQPSPPFSLGGLSFWADTADMAIKLAPFTLERNVGAPFSENRFYAKAPMHTDDHIALLCELENILKKPN